MQISYNEACARDCSSLETDLELCERVGFDYIEIRFDMLGAYLKKHTVEELAAFFKASRLRPHAFNALYLYPEFLGPRDDPERQKALLSEFELACRVGREIGSHHLIVVPPLQRDPDEGPYVGDPADTVKSCVRILKELGRRAGPWEMKLCFELVGFERSSVRSISMADQIVRAVDLPNVGFVFDSYNIYLNGGCNDFSGIQSVQAEKIWAVHLMSGDDVPPGQRGQDKRCFCGSGVVDTDAFLKALKGTGYDGMVSVETFRPEYWQRSPEWVISTAYQTTRTALEKNGCLDRTPPLGLH